MSKRTAIHVIMLALSLMVWLSSAVSADRAASLARCPTEDSCALDYDGTSNRWTVRRDTP